MPDQNELVAAVQAMKQQADASRLANRPQVNPIVAGLANASAQANQAAASAAQKPAAMPPKPVALPQAPGGAL